MHRPDAFPAGITSRTAIIIRHAGLSTALLAGWPLPRVAAQAAAPSGRLESTTLPEGTIERRTVQFDARPEGFGMLHMMSYIADDMVLTKNGFSALAPTVFMRLEDVEHLYPTVFDLELRAYRRNDRP